MNTENFAFTLKKYITNSKLSVSTLSKVSAKLYSVPKKDD